MRLKFYPPEKLGREVLQIIAEFLDIKNFKIFYFGSRVSGKANERSDIDIGILGSQEVPLQILGNIREKINNLPTLYSIDFVDFQRVPENFKQVALQFTEPLQ